MPAGRRVASRVLDIVRHADLPGVCNSLKDSIPPSAPFLLVSLVPLNAELTMSTTLGDLISTLYAHFLAQYGDEELASVATAAVVNDLLSRPAPAREEAA